MLHRIFTLWSNYIASSKNWGTEGEKTRITTKGASGHVGPMGPAIVQRPVFWVPLIWDSVPTQESSLTGGRQVHRPNETNLGVPNTNFRSLSRIIRKILIERYDNALYHFDMWDALKSALRGISRWNGILVAFGERWDVAVKGIRS